jgi:hypothetical protein
MLIWGYRDASYFCARNWAGSITLNGQEKLVSGASINGERRAIFTPPSYPLAKAAKRRVCKC